MNSDNRQQLDLELLRSRTREKPRTKIGQVRQAWPCIKELFEAGHSLKDVCRWLNEIGIEIGYARLSDYVGQLRRAEDEQVASVPATPERVSLPPGSTPPDAPATVEPLANLLERERKRPGFQFNSDPDPRKLI